MSTPTRTRETCESQPQDCETSEEAVDTYSLGPDVTQTVCVTHDSIDPDDNDDTKGTP